MSQPVGRRGIADSWPKNERCTYCGNLFGEHPIQSGEQICHGQRLELPPSDDVKPYTREEMGELKNRPMFGGFIETLDLCLERNHVRSGEHIVARLWATAHAGLEDRERLDSIALIGCTEIDLNSSGRGIWWTIRQQGEEKERGKGATLREAIDNARGVRPTPSDEAPAPKPKGHIELHRELAQKRIDEANRAAREEERRMRSGRQDGSV